MNGIIKKISLAISTLVVIELFLGFRGRVLIIGDLPVRYLLIMLQISILYVRMSVCIFERAKSNKVGMISQIKQDVKLLGLGELSMFCFILLNLIWIVVIPYIRQTQMSQVIRDVNYLLLLLLYFPAVYLIRIHELQWKKFRKVVMVYTGAIVLLHIVFYIGETWQKAHDPSIYFVQRILDVWSDFVHGHCYFDSIMMPKYSVRIIYVFNYVLLLAFYFLMDVKKRWIRWGGVLLSVMALLTTGTRTVILAPLIGLCGYYLIYNFTIGYKKRMWKRHLGTVVCVIVVTCVIDFVGFQGRTLIRMSKSFTISDEVLANQTYETLTYSDASYSKENEIRGTVNSNTTRILELRHIIKNYKNHPLFGYGFGSMGEVNDSIVQDESDTDIQGITLLVKGGIIGCLVWAGYIIFLVYEAILQAKKGNEKSLRFLFLLISIGFSCMLNITIQTFTIYMLLYGYLESKYQENELQALRSIEQ